MEHYFTNNEALKSEFRTITYKFQDSEFCFTSDNGVFSKNKIDFGSRFLVETFLKDNKKPTSILDVGCGYGFIGIVLAKILHCKVTLIDVNKRAVHLAKKNSKDNQVVTEVYESNCYDTIKDTYDVIITNPPIRAGKKIVLDILLKAKDYLNEEGCLWFVIRKDQGAKSIQKKLGETYKIELLKKDKGFFVFKAKKN